MRSIYTYSVGLAMMFCTLLSANEASAKFGKEGVSSTDNGISFKENKGQLRDQHAQLRNDVDFSINAGNLSVFIGDGQIHYQWSQLLNGDMAVEPNIDPLVMQEEINKKMQAPMAIQRLDVELVGANKNAVIERGNELPYYENYLSATGGDEMVVHTYNTITYKNVYPNIDWVLYTKNGQLKYDFIVHPGGNVLDIKIKYNGADKIEMNEGNVTISTPMGSITEQAPYSYSAETKALVASSFELSDNTLRFGVADYSGTLVIDPWLEWATYYGGSNQDWSNCSATDLLGNVYMGGFTYSTNNIITSGAYQDTLTPQIYSGYPYNGFIAKFNLSGVRQWGTYFPAHVTDITTTPNGDVYFVGSVDSITGLATTGVHQTTFAGRGPYTGYYYQGDAYLAKFTSSGSRIWFTYYGGEDMDRGTSVAVDQAGFVYLGGATNSLHGIATSNSFQDTLQLGRFYPGSSYYYGQSGFLAKFTGNGTRVWGTYFNGSIADIATDLNNNIYCTGNTWHDSGVATNGAYQNFHSATIVSTNNYWEAFLVKFTSAGARVWGTYYGGFNYDWGMAVECDPSGNAYMAGNTYSTQFIASTGAHQTALSGSYDAFLTKFMANGTRSWGTYFGGTNYEYGGSLVVTPSYRVYLNGSTTSTNGIATTGAYQATNAGNYDDYIAEFDTAGVQRYGTYYGGTGQEYSWGYGGYGWGNGGDALSYNYTGRLHLASATYSSGSIATSGAHQTTNSGNYDAYLATFIIDTIAYFVHPFGDTTFCAGDTVRIPYKTSYPFNSGNVFTMQLSNASGSFTAPVSIGTKTATTGDTIICVIPQNTPSGGGYRMRILSSAPFRVSVDNFVNLSVYNPGNVTASNNGPLCAGDTLRLTASNNATGVTYSWTGVNSFTSNQQNPTKINTTVSDAGNYIVTATAGGCSVKDTTSVIVYPIPAKPSAGSNTPVCPNTTLNLYATHSSSSVSYSWAGPGGFTSSQQNPSRNNATYAMAGQYTVTATQNGCTSEPDTAVVVVAITTPTPQANSNSPVCAGQQIVLTATTISNATYSWHGPNSFTSTQQNPSIPNASATNAGAYYVKATVNGCESLEDSVVVVVNPTASVAIFPNPGDSICVGETATFIAITNNGGGSATYSWIKNGTTVSGATSTSYSTNNLNTGDVVACLLSNIPNCPGYTDTSNKVTMTVRPVMAPTVSITANPNTPLEPMQLVTFTAQTTYGGNNPTFQWMRNGQPVIGATSSTWGTYQLSNGDSIYTILTSSDRCADPDTAVSNGIKVQVLLSVDDVNQLGNVTLYPNPNNGTFTIKGKLNTNKEISINVMNAIGQSVYRSTATPNGYELNHTVNIGTQLAAGTYLLHLQSGDDVTTLRFTVQQ